LSSVLIEQIKPKKVGKTPEIRQVLQ